MKDSQIVELYHSRDEQAIEETKNKYQAYLYTIAYQILGDSCDSEEAVNDTYAELWNSIPPHNPNNLKTFSAKLIHHISVDRRRKQHAAKRVPSELTVSMSELEEAIGEYRAWDEENRAQELGRAINAYLHTLSARKQRIFVCRYYCSDPILQIANALGLSESSIKKELAAIRKGLKKYLEQEGFYYE